MNTLAPAILRLYSSPRKPLPGKLLRWVTRSLLLLLLSSATPLFGQGGPPLRTDDPGTPGPRNWEINVGLTADCRSTERAFNAPSLDMNYGVGERIQLNFVLPFIIQGADGEPTRSGLGNTNMGVKWRFFEDKKHELAFSTYPHFGFNNPTDSVRRGIADPGLTLLWPFQVAKKIGPIDVNGEAGYQFSQKIPDLWIAGLALGHQATPRLEMLGELYRQAEIGTGVHENTFDLGGRFKLRDSLVLLFMAGRSFSGPSSGQPQFIGYFGLQFLVQRKSHD